jgi:uncharacterized membrane protein YfcA
VTTPHDVLLLVSIVIFGAYLVFGITGFGASPITIPVLVHLLPLAFVLPLAALLDLGSALALGFHTRRQADSRELLTLVPFTLLGRAHRSALRHGRPAVRHVPRRPHSRPGRATRHHLADGDPQRRIASVAFALAGLLASTALWLAVAALLPVAWAGVWAGHRAYLRLTPATAAQIIAAALFMAGAALIARTL